MANRSPTSKRDPYTHEREHNAFLRELRQFHQSRGTSFRHSPRINGRELDLLLLYSKVTAMGGCHKVNASRKWDTLLPFFNIPSACPNAGLALKQIYIRYLDIYEKIHFLGEDPNDANAEKTDSRGRKLQQITINNVPMTYNHHQHELSDALRLQLGLSQDAAIQTEYDKLAFSLLSGLPNEVDFAINICTLLSNGSRHSLSLDKCPRLLELLIAQAGVWSDTNNTIRGLLEASWQRQEGRKMAAFWEDTLEDEEIRELLGPWEGKCKDVVEEDHQFFNLARDNGVRDSEGQRVLQIASILRNLSLDENNLSILVSSPVCLKFLLLCAHCRWSNLRQLGLDALGGLSSEMVLDPCDELSTQLVFRTITFNLLSNDRFLIIKSLEMLIGLCQMQANDDVLVRNVTNRVYERVCTYLTIHDIMLLVYTLEFLFHITQFGSDPCNKIARLHGVIAILIDLMTFEAQSYGPTACISMKLVDSPQAISHSGGFMAAPAPPSLHRPHSSYVPHPSPHGHRTNTVNIPAGYQELDNETFACTWLKATYEIGHGQFVAHTDVYNEYQTVCIKLGKKGLIGPTQLSHYIRSVFPHVMPRRSEGGSEMLMDGIRKRHHPMPVSIIAPIASSSSQPSHHHASGNLGYPLTISPSMASSCVSPSRSQSPLTHPTPTGHSPILKAQLSAPPRGPIPSPPQLQSGKSHGSPPPSPATPNKDASSNLIKSLLANKVNQNIQRQQQQLLLNQQKQGGPVPTTPTTPAGVPRTYQRTPMTLPGICPSSYRKSSISVPMTLEECLGPPTMASSPVPPPRTVPSQLSAMLGHCDPPPPLPPPSLTKDLIVAQNPVRTKLDDAEPVAGQDMSLVVGARPPLQSSAFRLSPTAKMRINGIQRPLATEACGATLPFKCDGGSEAVAATTNNHPHTGVARTEENHVTVKGAENVVSTTTTAVSAPTPTPLNFNSKLTAGGNGITDAVSAPSGVGDRVRVEQRRGLFGARLTLHNGNKVVAPVSPAAPVPAPVGIPTHVITSTSPSTTAAVTGVNVSAPTVTANSLASGVPTSPAKNKGLLADLLDGKVHKDSFLLMNGVLDKKVERREPVTNHQPVTSEVPAPSPLPNSAAANSTGTVTPAIPKNCNLTNGESFNHAAPSVVVAAPLPAAPSPMMMPARVAASVVGQGGAVRPGGAMRVAASTTAGPTTQKPAGTAGVMRHQTVITGNVRAAMVNNRFQPIKPASPATPSATSELIGSPRIAMEQLNQTTPAAVTPSNVAVAKRPAVAPADSSTAEAKRLRLCDGTPTVTARPPLSTVSSQPNSTSPSPSVTLKISIPPAASTGGTSVSPGGGTRKTLVATAAATNHMVQTNFVLKRDPSGRPATFVMSPVGPSAANATAGATTTTALPSVTAPQKLQVRLVPGNPADLAAISAAETAASSSQSANQQQKVSSATSEEQHRPSTTTAPAPTSAPVAPPTVKLRYFCEWKDCQRSFESPSAVFFHACKVHAPKGSVSIPCLWDNCDQMVRQRLSHMTHLQDRHCSEQVLRTQAMRKLEATRGGGPPAPPAPAATLPPHPGYAPNAALHAIKRHALEFLNPREFVDEKEGPVTKSVRLTAALIFRNLIVYSTLAKKTAKQYESFLATVAISNVEASQTIAYCLAEIGNHSEHPPKK